MARNQITKHFTRKEFAQPERHGFLSVPYPEDWLDTRLLSLCQQLEGIRTALGKPIQILSGYRSAAYNRRIGGARMSQHVDGRAADIVVPGVKAQDVHDLALSLHRSGKIMITGLGNYPTFTHIDVRPGSRLVRWSGVRGNA